MGEIRMTRDFFLWSMSVIYLFAFSSLFVQIPGLYGDKGILPAKFVAQKEAESLHDLLTGPPTLLRLLPRIGLDTMASIDFLCLGGIILSFVAMISRPQRSCIVFGLLWAFYLSLFQIGQTFLWFQWDILLLEAGFLTILVAPLNLFRWRAVSHHNHDKITFWLVKWLVFRLMFASGVVKLTSQCPTWWGLTALNYHYETQCIPNPMAWWMHQLPEWFHRLSVALVYIIEIPVPFLFFSPVRSQRLFAFYLQVLLMVMIILTGNFNFFNWLTIAICFSLIDDNFLRKWLNKPPVASKDEPEDVPVVGPFWKLIRWALNIVVYGGLAYLTVKLFNILPSMDPSPHIHSEITFSNQDLVEFLESSLPLAIWIGGLSLSWEILKAFFKGMKEHGMFSKVRDILGVGIFGAAALSMFAVSLVPLTQLGGRGSTDLHPMVYQLHSQTRPYKLTSPYGLFRRGELKIWNCDQDTKKMTGVGGRPEVIIEGSRDAMQWTEYDFLYKPGNLLQKPPVVAPHQPRLDWQMWFAALGSYQQNPWFLNFVYRLFNNEPDVLALMGPNPFPDKPPKYIRATLYHYYFSRSDPAHEWHSNTDWWVRKEVREYLPTITKTEHSFVSYLKQAGLYEEGKKETEPAAPCFLTFAMRQLRWAVGQPDGFSFIIALFLAGLILTYFDPTVRLMRLPKAT